MSKQMYVENSIIHCKKLIPWNTCFLNKQNFMFIHVSYIHNTKLCMHSALVLWFWVMVVLFSVHAFINH